MSENSAPEGGATVASAPSEAPQQAAEASQESDYSRDSMFEGGQDYEPQIERQQAQRAPQEKYYYEGQNAFLADAPEDIQQRPWFKELVESKTSKESMWKQFDHMQEMVGKKTLQVPDENATAEQTKEFYKQLGVPDSPEAYKIENVKWDDSDKPLGAIIDQARVPQVVDAVKQAAQATGITPKQLNTLITAYESAQMKHQKQELQQVHEAETAKNQDFAVIGHKYFGDKYPDVMSRASNALANFVSNHNPQLQADIAQLDNKSLMILAAAVDGVYRRHGREDSLAGRGMAATSATDLKTQAMQLMKKPEFADTESSTYKQVVALWKQHSEAGGS